MPNLETSLRSTLAVAMVHLALLACAPASPPPPEPAESPPLPAPDPLLLTPGYDRARAARAVIGAEGGTLRSTSADGATVELSVPAGALAMPTAMTLTPIVAVDEDLGGPVVAGAQLDPPGLLFARPATLTLTAAAPLARGPVTATLGGLPRADLPSSPRAAPMGELAVLVETPVCSGGAFSHVTVPVTAGTSAILLDGSPGTLEIVQTRVPANVCLQMENAFELKRLTQHLATPCGPIDDDLSMVLNDLYFQLVNPVLVAATTDSTRFNEAVHTFYCWAALLNSTGGPETRVMSGNLNGGADLLAEAANRVVSGARDRCAAHDLTAARDLAKVLALLLAEFIRPQAAHTNLDTGLLTQAYADCMTFRIDARLRASYEGYWPGHEEHGALRLHASSRTFLPDVALALANIKLEGAHAIAIDDYFEVHVAYPGDSMHVTRMSLTDPAGCASDTRLDPVGKVQVSFTSFDAVNLTDPLGPNASGEFSLAQSPCGLKTASFQPPKNLVQYLPGDFHRRAGLNGGSFLLANWAASAAPGNPVFATMSLASGRSGTPLGDEGGGQESWLFELVHTPH